MDKTLLGPDHWFSEDPNGLKNWVDSIKTAYVMLGTSEVIPTKDEEGMKKIARRSIIALIDIEQNETLNKNNIGIRRPGTGLPPIMFEEILGKKSTNKILKGQLLKLEDFR